MYKVEFTKQAIKDLQRIPKNYTMKIFDRIKLLAKGPFNEGLDIKKLKGVQGYRLRVGEYRVIYEMEKDKLVINVIKIQSRGNVYG